MESFNPDTDETSDVNNGSDYADLRRMLPGMFGAEQDDDESNAIPIGQRIVGMGGADPSDGGNGVQRVDDEDFSGPPSRNFGSDEDRAPQGDESARLAAHNIDAGLGFGDPAATETDDGDEFGDPLAAYRSNDRAVGGAMSDGDSENAGYGDVSGLSDSGQGQDDEGALVGGESEPDGEEDSDTASEEEEPSGADEDAATETNAEPDAASPPAARGGKHSGTKSEPVPVPVLKGSVGGKGATNNPEDVKAVQRLLNLAIKNDELPGFGSIPEDGKVTDSMLKMVHAYQKVNGLLPSPKSTPDQVVISPGKGTLQKLASNRLADPRWSMYDETIKKEVNYYNNFFKGYPGFEALDWRLVKAMLWTEVEGPTLKEWYRRPMQVKPNDPGLKVLQTGGEDTAKFVPRELRETLRKAYLGDLNVRAGVAWLVRNAMDSKQTIVDKPERLTAKLNKGDTLNSFARRMNTTVEQIYRDNPGLEGNERSLREGLTVAYHIAHETPHWIGWDQAMKKYNSQTSTPDNAEKVRTNYRKIQGVWSR